MSLISSSNINSAGAGSGSGGGASYTAGTGINISGNNEISTDMTVVQGKLTAGTGITIDEQNNISATGGASSETFLQADSYNEDYPQNNSYIDLSPNDPTALKSNNSDFYCSFITAPEGLDHDQTIFYVEKVCGIGLDAGALKSWNWGNNTSDTIISSVNGGERYDLKCEIRNDGENTTRKWYRKISDTWTAITDAEFTDNGVDPTNTNGIRLFANVADARAPFHGIIVWDSLKIDINGQTAFDATTATRESGEGNCYIVHGLLEKTVPF